jgi:hypothetical protein
LLITNINLLLLLLFFYYWPCLYLCWISSPLNDIKYQLCYLKRCLYTQKFYLFIVTSFFYYFFTCSFSVFVENCILLPMRYKLICCVPQCIVHVWFWFFILLPRFLLLVIKGQFFPRTKILFQSAFFIFRYKNIASKSLYQNKIHPFPLMQMQRNVLWYTYTPLGI